MEDMQIKFAAFEHAYTLSADDAKRAETIKWLRARQTKGGYTTTTLQASFIGFCLARTTHIDIQVAWEMAGGNPSIKATREDLESALKALDEVCDDADESIPLAEVWDALGGDSNSDTPTLKNVRTLLLVTKAAVGTLAAQRRVNKNLPMSMGFRGPTPDRNGNVFELPSDIPELLAEAYNKSVQERPTVSEHADVILMAPAPDSKPNLPRRAPKVNAGARLRKSEAVPKSTAMTMKSIGREMLSLRKSLDMNQTEFGQLIGLTQTVVSAAERGVVRKVSDKGVSAIESARAVLDNARGIVIARTGNLPKKTAKFQDGIRDPLHEKVTDWHTAFAAEHGGQEWHDLRTFVSTVINHSSLPRSSPIKVGVIDLYLRAGKCLFNPVDGKRHNAIEVARITIPEEHQGQGHAKRFFAMLEKYAYAVGIEFITVAQVHNEEFRSQLTAWGFRRFDVPSAPEDFIYIKEVERDDP